MLLLMDVVFLVLYLPCNQLCWCLVFFMLSLSNKRFNLEPRSLPHHVLRVTSIEAASAHFSPMAWG